MQPGRLFVQMAKRSAHLVGSAPAFVAAVVVIIIWVVLGPVFGFSDTWQLVINTITTLITFLIVFVIQNTQNRDALAVQLKLDELLRAVVEARTGLVNLEELSDDQLEKLEAEFRRLGRRAAKTAPKKEVGPG